MCWCLFYLGWCKALCLSNNREYIASSKTLETIEDGLPVEERDLSEGNKEKKVKILEIKG